MNFLYPRLTSAVAEQLYADAGSLSPALEHRSQIFAPVGGRRATTNDLAVLRASIHDLAGEFGYPAPLANRDIRAFDRRTASVLVSSMPMSWSEATARGVWSFLALVVLPDLTRWRFGYDRNPERWIATDLTRHTWARAWWQGTLFAGHLELLDELTESDLNQIFERRVIGGDARLATEIARAVLDVEKTGNVPRRALIRDTTARMRRRLAFVDARALSDDDVEEMCRGIAQESLNMLTPME